jgi:long-subunit acyl-CoA synthetase (AMP-forming)
MRSVQNMKGYWRKDEETARAFADGGWLKTGDAGFVDAEGYVFLTDRVKDMIVSGGENITRPRWRTRSPGTRPSPTSR